MADQTEYKLTKRRTTDELENDTTTVDTKRVLLYGYDYSASAKVRLACDGNGLLGVTI